MNMLERIADGRTDLVFDYLEQGHPYSSKTSDGASLLQWCAYYGDVSAIKFLLTKGEELHSLGEDMGLNAAAFHGHWRLCQFLIESGANVNARERDTGETPLHAALSSHRVAQHWVVKVLLDGSADPNLATNPSAESGAFMRDVRTRGETPLHRAAAFASEDTIQLLLDAGAKIDAVTFTCRKAWRTICGSGNKSVLGRRMRLFFRMLTAASWIRQIIATAS
jgi:ankyrin repeat protein